jgi:hypothetical protein
MLRVQNTRADNPGPLRYLVYGASGSGKTTAAATFPRPLFVDCEGGLLSVQARGVDYVRCGSVSDVVEALNLARTHAGEFGTVVVDSLTEVARLVVEATARRTDQLGKASAPSLAEWGRCVQVIRQLVRGFTSLPMDVVFTALPRQVRAPSGEVRAINPWLPGRLADEVAAGMDFVLFLYGQEDEDPKGERSYQRMLLTAPHKKVFAKDRSGALPLWVEPTWEALARHLGRRVSAPVTAAA